MEERVEVREGPSGNEPSLQPLCRSPIQRIMAGSELEILDLLDQVHLPTPLDPLSPVPAVVVLAERCLFAVGLERCDIAQNDKAFPRSCDGDVQATVVRKETKSAALIRPDA